MTFDAQSFLSHLTSHPGVYCMRDADGALLYVGKAKNLQNRLKSYFQKNLTPKTAKMVAQIAAIDVTVTPSEKEALLLEGELIKSEKPRYNILLRDDKSYPYLFLSEDAFPRLASHRGTQKDKGVYFGPYPSAHSVKSFLDLGQKLFKLRQCANSFFKNRSRPCLQYQIKRCSGPCVGLIEEEDYRREVELVKLFLNGKSDEVIATLVQQMQKASTAQRYEEAARLRDQIATLRNITEEQSIIGQAGNADILGIASEKGDAAVHVLYVRNGRLLGTKTFFPKVPLHQGPSEVLAAFIWQKYGAMEWSEVPADLIVSIMPTDPLSLAEALSDKAKHAVQIQDSVRTHKASWLKMAQTSADAALKTRLHSGSTYRRRLESLASRLGLEEINSMECFDISHTHGEATVASCVIFDASGPKKAAYRRFNIKTVTNDDTGAMKEALMRHYKRLKTEEAPLPDVLFVDGGKGQLNKAIEVLAECQIHEVLLVGIAKGEGRKPGLETLYVYQEEGIGELDIPADQGAHHLIEYIRNEAHRFAIAGHRKKRDKTRQTSTLEALPGIGKNRAQKLLIHFGGLQQLTLASQKAISEVPGISDALAKMIFQSFRKD